MRKVKKSLCVLSAGVIASALVLGVACGGNNDGEDLSYDKDAPAFENPDAVLTLSGAIDKTTASKQISSDLFGIFLEDINYASYALDNNLVANGSFEYAKSRTYAWSGSGVTLSAATQDGVFKGNSAFAADVNPSYAALKVDSANGSISNSGYKAAPIAVKEGVQYTFSAFIKASDYNGDFEVAVVKGSTEYAKATVSVTQSNDWVKYVATLTATDTEDTGLSFKITFHNTGSLSIDNVLLQTGDSTIGIKNYLYNAIADLSPAFIRFPGGCIIEGRNDDSAYDWKSSIGATTVAGENSADTVPALTYTQVKDGTTSTVTTYGERATRVPNTDIWQATAGDSYHEKDTNTYYEMEYGIGFYEYFVLCDTLGASAIPIVNCGMGCQTQSNGPELQGRHGNKINDFIQDAKDLICFAKGSVTATDKNEAYWAKVRSDMGHPEPFEMDYIGIGNEQWGEYYTKYYEKFLVALAQAAEENPIYATVKPIVGNSTMMGHCEYPETNRKGVALDAATNYKNAKKIDMISEYGVVDQHYYMNYTDFFAAATDDFYKGYVRPEDGSEGYTQDNTRYYDVFVGEYSANRDVMQYPTWDDSKTNTIYENCWITALSEAAMMTTFEKNGDIVKLAAYAPMFGNLTMTYTQWPVNMMFYNNTSVVLTTNYYVQQLFMKNAGDHKVDASLTFPSGEMPTTSFTRPTPRTVNNLYYVTSMDEETGDIIIKIVNAGEDSVKFNLSLGGLSESNKGVATVTKLAGALPEEKNTLDTAVIAPETYKIGAFTDNTVGYEAEGYSVTAIRVRTK